MASSTGWRERQRGEPGSTDPSLNSASQSGVQTGSFHMNVSCFWSLRNIPGHSFLLPSHILKPLLGMASSSWLSMNDASHCPQGWGSVICDCHCRDAKSSFEMDWSQHGLALAQPSRGINALLSLLCFPWPSQMHTWLLFPQTIFFLYTQIFFSTHLCLSDTPTQCFPASLRA